MKKNNFLYDFIFGILSDEKKLTFLEIDVMAKESLGNQYDQKQLRNLLYNLVHRGKINIDEKKCYYRNVDKEESNIICEYLNEIEVICKKTEEKLKNPFEVYHGKKLLEADKLYQINKKIVEIIKQYKVDA